MQTMPYSLVSFSFWRAYWVTLRPYLFFVSGAAGLLGLAMTEGMRLPAFAAAFLAFFFSYGLGQALTDVFQTDTDAISSPYRPLVRGIVSRGQVAGVSLAGLALCATVFLLCNLWTGSFAAACVAGLAVYTPFKRRWWAGPLWNSWIVALLPAIGLLCGGADVADTFSSIVLWYGMGSVFFSYGVFVLLGYFKDISADRATGYRTLPVVVGWRPSVLISLVLAAAGLGCSCLLVERSGLPGRALRLEEILTWLFLGGGAASLLVAHAVMWRTRREGRAHVSIALVVRGFVLLHLGEAAALMPGLALPAVSFYALFEAALAGRPEETQV